MHEPFPPFAHGDRVGNNGRRHLLIRQATIRPQDDACAQGQRLRRCRTTDPFPESDSLGAVSERGGRTRTRTYFTLFSGLDASVIRTLPVVDSELQRGGTVIGFDRIIINTDRKPGHCSGYMIFDLE